MPISADIEHMAGAKTFASGLLVELIAALRRTRPGDLVAVVSSEPSVGPTATAVPAISTSDAVSVARSGLA